MSLEVDGKTNMTVSSSDGQERIVYSTGFGSPFMLSGGHLIIIIVCDNSARHAELHYL